MSTDEILVKLLLSAVILILLSTFAWCGEIVDQWIVGFIKGCGLVAVVCILILLWRCDPSSKTTWSTPPVEKNR